MLFVLFCIFFVELKQTPASGQAELWLGHFQEFYGNFTRLSLTKPVSLFIGASLKGKNLLHLGAISLLLENPLFSNDIGSIVKV